LHVVISAAISTVVYSLIGMMFYLAMGVLVFVVSFAIVHANESAYKHGGLAIDDKLMERTALDFLTQLGLVSFAAAFWPSLPIIFLRGERGKRGDRATASENDVDDHRAASSERSA
jgi:hypothetical protein